MRKINPMIWMETSPEAYHICCILKTREPFRVGAELLTGRESKHPVNEKGALS